MISEVTRNSDCVAEWMKERASEAGGHTRGVSWACERQCLVRGGGGEVPIKEVREKKVKKTQWGPVWGEGPARRIGAGWEPHAVNTGVTGWEGNGVATESWPLPGDIDKWWIDTTPRPTIGVGRRRYSPSRALAGIQGSPYLVPLGN